MFVWRSAPAELPVRLSAPSGYTYPRLWRPACAYSRYLSKHHTGGRGAPASSPQRPSL